MVCHPGACSAGEDLLPPQGSFLLATLFGAPVGCGALRYYERFAEIKRMWVDAGQRGCGIGSRILRALEQEALENGHRILRLDTNATLKAAQALYEHSGYRRIERYNENPYAELWYEKRLRRE